MTQAKYIVGKKFGQLTVLAEIIEPRGIWHNRYLKCLCDCGREANVRQDHLTRGKTISCGCLARSLQDASRAGASEAHYAQLLARSKDLAAQAIEKTKVARAERVIARAKVKAERLARIDAEKAAKQAARQARIDAKEAARMARLNRVPATTQERNHRLPSGTYERMLTEQGGVCAICGTKPRRKLHVDHCHTNGHVRGLLCGNCNAGLGFFKDNILVMAKAMKYLTDTAKEPVM